MWQNKNPSAPVTNPWFFLLLKISQGGPFSSEADIQRGPGLKKDTKYHYNLEYKVKIKKNMVNLKYKQHALIKNLGSIRFKNYGY